MNKSIMIAAIASMILMTAPQQAEAQFLKKLGKAISDTAKETWDKTKNAQSQPSTQNKTQAQTTERYQSQATKVTESSNTGTVSPSFVLNKGTLGPIAIGKLYTTLPQKVEGLYDRFEYKKEHHQDDMDGEWTEEYVMFYKDGKEVLSTGVDGKKITAVTLLNNATHIKTGDGYYIGYNARKLFQEKRMEWGTYYMGEVFASKDGYTYFVSSDDVNAEIPEKVSDFKVDAKVSKIVYSEHE